MCCYIQVPISELRNDARDNILGSLILAGQYILPEVCMCVMIRPYFTYLDIVVGALLGCKLILDSGWLASVMTRFMVKGLVRSL